ncbi:MAG: ATP-binding protein [Candidatus Omnitrophota bacterium]
MVIYCIVSSLINGVTSLFFGIFVIRQSHRNLKNITYFFFSLSVAVWSFAYFLWQNASDYQTALFYSRGLMVGASFIPIFYLHHILVFLNQVNSRKKILRWSYFFAICSAVLCFTPLFVSGVSPKLGFKFWPDPGLLFHPFLFFWVGLVIYGTVLIYQEFRKSSGMVRNQMRYILLATAIGWIGGATNYILWYGIPIPPVGNILVSGYVGIAAYVIIKYRLMDVRLAVTRTGIFVLIYCVIIGIPAFLIFQMRSLLERQLGINWWLLPAGLFSLLSFVGPFIYMTVQRRAEAVLLREQKAYQQTLLQASRGMTLIKDLSRLLRLMVHILTKTIRITHARIFLWDREGKQFICKAARGDHRRQGSDIVSEATDLIQRMQDTKEPLILEEIRAQGAASLEIPDEVIREMERLDAAVVVPSFVQERLLGFVVLGDKKSKRLYTESDLDTLTTLANQAALAIENCVFLTEFEQQQAHFFQAAKMADLGTMAAGIAHQINNRFCVIKLGVESAQLKEIKKLTKFFQEHDFKDEQGMAETLAKLCERVAKSSDHGSEIVRRLLSFSRLSEGFRPVLIRELATSCIRLWECKRSLSEIDFYEEIPDGLPKVHGNFSELEEILFNLLDNAFDAITMKREAWTLGTLEKPVDPEKGRIALSAKEAFRNKKRCVEIIVTDNGLGMSEADKQKVFVPFFTTKATAVKGTGLGLYVIRKMVDAHHGDIELESVRGQGTTFRVFIPIVTEV